MTPDFIYMLMIGWIMALTAFIVAGGLCWVAFSILYGKAFKLGEESGWRRSTNAPPKVMEEMADDAFAEMMKDPGMRGAMGQNGEVEEFNGGPTDDLGYPIEDEELQPRNNFRGRHREEAKDE